MPSLPEHLDRRGFLLVALHACYPGSKMAQQVAKSLDFAYPEGRAAFARDVAYLEGLGLLATSSVEVGATAVQVLRLTSAGVDVVVGVTSVAGVHVDAAVAPAKQATPPDLIDLERRLAALEAEAQALREQIEALGEPRE